MYTCHIHKCTNTQKNDITTYWGLVTLKYYFRVSSQGLSKVSEQAFYRNNSKDKESGQYEALGLMDPGVSRVVCVELLQG